MQQFEYVMVLSGVVVAVAMTEIVGAWGRILRTDARVKIEPLFVGWTCYLLLLSMLYWVSMWPYQNVEFVYMAQVWLLVFPTLFLVLVAFALTPDVPNSGELDLRRFYFKRRRRVFFSLAAFILAGGIARALIAERILLDDVVISAIWIGSYLILTVTRKPLVHWAILVLLLLQILAAGIHEINVKL